MEVILNPRQIAHLVLLRCQKEGGKPYKTYRLYTVKGSSLPIVTGPVGSLLAAGYVTVTCNDSNYECWDAKITEEGEKAVSNYTVGGAVMDVADEGYSVVGQALIDLMEMGELTSLLAHPQQWLRTQALFRFEDLGGVIPEHDV